MNLLFCPIVQAAGAMERKVVMTRSLPPKPSLRFLQEQAKDLVKAQRRKEPTVCGMLRLLRRFHDASDAEILAAKVALHEAQFALAMEYGFPSWEALVHKVASDGEATVFRDERAAKAVFQGDRLRQDTFSLAVAAALKSLGKPVDYATVHLWSGNAFAPDIRPDEPTRCHWQLQGRERCLDVIAAAAGVQARTFPSCEELVPAATKPEGMVAGSKKEQEWERETFARPAASYLSHALQVGEMVVSCGEWAQPARGVLWCDWGLVVEARNDGTILGTAPNGRADNVITHVRDGWVLRADGEPQVREYIRRLVLQRAVERIRGAGPAFKPAPRGVVFGLAAMDAWISAMSQVPFDQQQWQGKDWSAGQARETALPTFWASQAAAGYLRQMAGELPAAAASALRDAAGQYDRIVELLTPPLADSGEQTYPVIMGDPAKQTQHVQQVLCPVRGCLEAAAAAIEKVLMVA
jgi:hypothetical protein